jgi:type IV pilus assembly protein PilC
MESMDKKDGKSRIGGSGNRGKVKAQELSLFCYQMSIVLRSGIQFSEGVTMIAEEISDKRLKKALDAIGEDLGNGNTFYSSVEKHDIFPKYMKAMIKIGETTGSLDNIMEYLSNYFERNEKLSKKIKSAVIYPFILLGLMTGIILLLVLKVLPMFDDILANVGGEMPGITKAMLNMSVAIKNYMVIILIIIALIVFAIYFYVRTPAGRKYMDKLRFNMPIVKNITKKIYGARFSMVMSILIKSGIEHSEALDMVKEVVGNSYAAGKIEECKKMIEEGKDIKDAYAHTGIFSRIFVKMISIGYKTGDMDNMMLKITGVYESEVDNSLNKATSVIEPVLVIILSLVVGVILLTVMLPLINIMSSIG